MNLKPHPTASLFPMLSEIETRQLADSIKSDGLMSPIVFQGDWLIDGRNRLKACELAGVEPKFVEFKGEKIHEYIVAVNLHRRHLSESQRAMVAAKLANLGDGERSDRSRCANLRTLPITQPEAAALLNVSRRLVQEAKALQQESPALAAKVESGKISLHDARKQVKQEAVQAKVKKMAQDAELVPVDERWLVLAGDMADQGWWGGRAPYDAIITDPPYPQEFLPLYESLAKRAADNLKEDGILCVMTGQTWLPQVLELMTPYLKYYWTGAYHMPGPCNSIADRPIINRWKPLLFFIRLDASPRRSCGFCDFFPGADKGEKDSHEWQQTEVGMLNIVKTLCKPGASVMDPFSGSGTTGVAALKHGCIYTGIELDETTAKASRKRLSEVKND